MLITNVRLVPVGRTGDDTAGPVDLHIVDGRVRAVGPNIMTADDVVLDGGGRWAVPGLWDAHVHLRQWAQTRTRLDVGSADSAAAVTRLVAAHIEGSEGPVLGYGYRSAVWPQQPTVAELDAVSGARPVILTSGDGHNGWLNSAALAKLGAPPRTGALTENEWFALMPAITALTAETVDDTAALRAVTADAAARGIVGITDFELAWGFRDWPEHFAAGVDQLRVRAAIYPDGLDAVIDAGLRTGNALSDTGGLAVMGPLKIISDGSLNTRTAWCCQPYADAHGLPHPYGVRNYRPDELTALLERAEAHGLDVAVHAIGDAAVTAALDTFDSTGARGSIEHAQLVQLADVARMATLGVRASVQPAHLLDDRDVTARCWPDRADRCFPFRSLHDAGVELALGSDAPVAPLDPWLAMAAAVHRSADDRAPWNQREAITAAEALAASTDRQTTLRPGSRGDVVLLDDDPLRAVGDTAATAAHLRGLRVTPTIVPGHLTHLDIP
jgi:predicted amidohydrolase YtcJ